MLLTLYLFILNLANIYLNLFSLIIWVEIFFSVWILNITLKIKNQFCEIFLIWVSLNHLEFISTKSQNKNLSVVFYLFFFSKYQSGKYLVHRFRTWRPNENVWTLWYLECFSFTLFLIYVISALFISSKSAIRWKNPTCTNIRKSVAIFRPRVRKEQLSLFRSVDSCQLHMRNLHKKIRIYS